MYFVNDVREYLYYLRDKVDDPKTAMVFYLSYFFYREYLLNTGVYYLPSAYATQYRLISSWMKTDFSLLGEIAFNMQLMPCDISIHGTDVWIRIQREVDRHV